MIDNDDLDELDKYFEENYIPQEIIPKGSFYIPDYSEIKKCFKKYNKGLKLQDSNKN